MSMTVIHGDIIEEREHSLHFAIEGDPDNTLWIPMSVVLDRDPDPDGHDVDILVETWWYNKNEERFG